MNYCAERWEKQMNYRDMWSEAHLAFVTTDVKTFIHSHHSNCLLHTLLWHDGLVAHTASWRKFTARIISYRQSINYSMNQSINRTISELSKTSQTKKNKPLGFKVKLLR